MVKVMPPKDFLATMFPGSNTGAEYQPNDNTAAGGSGTGQLWDKEKSILLKKVAKLLDSRKRAGRVEEERLQPETTASAQPITQDLPAQHLHQVQSTLHINTEGPRLQRFHLLLPL